MKKKTHYLILILSMLFMVSCGADQKEENDTETAKKAEPSTIVTTIVSELKPFEHYFEIQGHVVSKKNLLVLPEMGGLIQTIAVEEGQLVEKGQLIATLSSDILNANMDELEEQLALAKYVLDKQTKLAEQGLGAEIQLKEATSNYNTLIKTKETLQTQKDKYSVFAPFDGYVDEVFVSVGQLGGPASPIARLVNLDELYVSADVSENYLSTINEGQKVSVLFPTLEYQKNNLQLNRIGKQINPVNRTITVETKLNTKNEKVIPNLMAVMSLRDYYDTNSVVIPSRVILKDTKGSSIIKLINDKKKVEVRKIKTGLQYLNETQVLEGLKAGETIIDEGKSNVVEGQIVKIQSN
jgi:membrane fusion protein (multidrug efflux system)